MQTAPLWIAITEAVTIAALLAWASRLCRTIHILGVAAKSHMQTIHSFTDSDVARVVVPAERTDNGPQARRLNKRLLDELAEIPDDIDERLFGAIMADKFVLRGTARMPAHVFASVLRAAGLNNHDINDFKAWLSREHGVAQIISKRARVYPGIATR